ncbi:hypothetical protein F4781DRAFT_433784 [Annulohypoxylon bovei var. microspora]|nr:hypothetical protein F4781DRAFT_433784 [Annulohypoxylon bovei var. microspora]
MTSSSIERQSESDLQSSQTVDATQTVRTSTNDGTETPAKNECQVSNQQPTPESPKVSWPFFSRFNNQRYGMACRMGALILIGSLGALGNDLYYQGLNGKPTNDSQWPIVFGNALSTFVKFCLGTAVGIAFNQLAWLTVKTRGFKVETLDALFSACDSFLSLFHIRLYYEVYYIAIVAVLNRSLSLCFITPVSTLTTTNSDQISPVTCDNVPMLDFTRENKFGLSSDDQERAGMSYWDTDNNFYTYNAPSSELERIFQLTALSFTGPLHPSNPCQSFNSCTYSVNLDAPAYKCESRQEFGGNKKFDISQLLPTGNLLYASYSSIDEDEGGRPLAWNTSTSSAPGFGVFTELPSLWVGWVTKPDDYQPHIAECLMYNATTTYDMTFSGDQMVANRTNIALHSLLLPPGSLKSPQDDDYQQFSGYHAAGYEFRSWLSGTIISDPEAVFIDNTSALQSNLFGDTTGLPVSADLAATLEQRFRDYFLSMLSDTRLHSQVNSSVPCSVKNPVLVWKYEPFWLVLPYGLAVGATVACAIVGLICFHKNGYPADIAFSTFITTSRSDDLEKLAEGHSLGQWPMNKRILDTRLQFGELVASADQDNPPSRRAAFAFPDNVRDIKNVTEYL